MRELLLALAIIAAAAIVACSFRYTTILAGDDTEGVLDRWTGSVNYPWPDSGEPGDTGRRL
ncbi:MAG TPA: hypothetical protein VL403_12445 [Candidatus Kryptonia bacterium]|nr:hypothetical protein [Candidatus Kryptonia bacterium]